MTIQMLYDANNLYVSLLVRDNVVTYPKRGKKGDRVEMWIDGSAMAKKGKYGRLRMLQLAPGELKNDGKPDIRWAYPRKLKGKAPTGLKSDGVIRDNGYYFEFSIPITEISDPAPGLEPLGIAFIARDWDYDDPNEDEAAVASAPFDGRKARNVNTMGSFMLGGADGIRVGFYRIKPDAAGKKVAASFYADVGGDSRREYVFLVDRYLVITGLGLGDGEYYFYDMPKLKGTVYKDVEAKEVTGDNKSELFVKYTITEPGQKVEQEIMMGFQFVLDRIKVVYHQEVKNSGPGWTITNHVAIKTKKGKPATIIVSKPKSTGSVTMENYPDPDADLVVDWERILLPWDSPKKRVFTWETSQFIKN
jgi:hypothetical protein